MDTLWKDDGFAMEGGMFGSIDRRNGRGLEGWIGYGC